MANMTIDSTTGRYYAEVSVTGNFNLHLEKEFDSAVNVSVKTGSATKFAPAFTFQGDCRVIDYDFIVEIAKTVRIEMALKCDSSCAAPIYTITNAE